MTFKEIHPQKSANKPIAWVVSIGVHLGIGLLAFFITWSVIRVEEDPPLVVTSSWHEQPVHIQATLPMAISQLPTVEMELPVLEAPPKIALAQDGLAVLHHIASSGEVPEFARREQETEVQFMGLDAVAAKRIVYVVDASGSMLTLLTSAIEEIERSLRKLHPKQEFGIIFYQHDIVISVPPRSSLSQANATNISRAMEWINTSGKVIGTGGSNPIHAMKKAIKLKPDVIYLLSLEISGNGQDEIPADELLNVLNRLNRPHPSNGVRPIQIKCIQYWAEKPDPLMQKIAEIHGGDDGYTLIERGRVGR
jgi:hypothetical protein